MTPSRAPSRGPLESRYPAGRENLNIFRNEHPCISNQYVSLCETYVRTPPPSSAPGAELKISNWPTARDSPRPPDAATARKPSPDLQRRAPRQTRQQTRQIAGAKRHAARRRREIFRRDMKENRAAAPARGRTNIMIEHANEVVEPILVATSPQSLAASDRADDDCK